MRIHKTLRLPVCWAVPVRPVRAGANARIAGRLFVHALLWAVIMVSPAVAQQVVTYPRPALHGGGVVPISDTQTATFSGCPNTQDGTTTTSSNFSVSIALPLNLIQPVFPTSWAVLPPISIPQNLFTVSNGVSEGQGTYSQTGGPSTISVAGGTDTETKTYNLIVSGVTISETFSDLQLADLPGHFQNYLYTLTSTYNIVTGIQVFTWNRDIDDTQTPSPGCSVHQVITDTGTLTYNYNIPTSACAKPDKSYPVQPYYQAGSSYMSLGLPVPAWPSECYNNYSGDCIIPQSDGIDATIGKRGCNLTALAMLLKFAMVPGIDPETLNNFMKNPNTLYDAHHNVDIVDTVIDYQKKKPGGNLRYTLINGPDARTPSTSDELAAALDNGPVMAAVKFDASTNTWAHFLVVTGRACQADGTYKFSIVDPGSFQKTDLLSSYPKFNVRGYVTDPQDLSELTVGFTGPSGFITYDEQNNASGLDPVSGQTEQNIPNSHYTGDYISDPETETPLSLPSYFLDVKQPVAGSYRIVVTGTEIGSYTLTVRGYATDGTGGVAILLPGVTSPGSTSMFQVQFSSTSGTSLTVSRVATFQNTLADIANSLALGLIGNEGIANALTSKIQAASSAANSGQNQAARNILNAFLNQLSAQTGKHITGAAPQILLEDASSLISQLP